MISQQQPDKALQARLRRMIDATSMNAVVRTLRLGRTQLLTYLNGLPMNMAAFRGVEATLRAVPEDKPAPAKERAR